MEEIGGEIELRIDRGLQTALCSLLSLLHIRLSHS